MLPPLPKDGYYSPDPLCSTEELIGEVLGSNINTIMIHSILASKENLRTGGIIPGTIFSNQENSYLLMALSSITKPQNFFGKVFGCSLFIAILFNNDSISIF